MLYEMVRKFPHEIIYEEAGPFLSYYQPTHKHAPENKQDPITFRNSIRELESLFQKKNLEEFADNLLNPLREIAEDREFWNHADRGLVILATPSRCIVYRFPFEVIPFVSIGKNFLIKPLLKIFQENERFQILNLTQHNFHMLSGDQYGLEETEISEDIPTSMEEILGEEVSASYLTHGSYGDGKGQGVFHGHGSRKEEQEKDLENYFRQVDHIVYENFSKRTKVPLILLSLEKNQGRFKKLSRNPYLMAEGIYGDGGSLDKEVVLERALEIFTPIHERRVDDLVENYGKMGSSGLATDKLDEIVLNIVEGRVDTLLLEKDKTILSKINTDTGQLDFEVEDELELEDLQNELAVMVLKRKGNVYLVEKERMPTTVGIAAIYR